MPDAVASGLALSGRLVLGAVFVAFGVSKLGSAPQFKAALLRYRVVPRLAVPVLSVALPPIEVLTGAAVLARWGSPAGYVSAVVLLVSFTVGMTANLLRNERTPCGCGANPAAAISWWSVARNALLIALAAGAASESRLSATSSVADAALSVVLAAAAVAGWLAVRSLGEIYSSSPMSITKSSLKRGA